MPLVDLTDVRDHLPQMQIDAESKPDESTVEEWLGEIETTLLATIQSLPPKRTQLAAGACAVTYVTPIDPGASPVTANILKEMILHAVTARILRSSLYGIGDVNASGAGQAQKFYDDRIMWLADPNHPFSLPDAEVLSETNCQPNWFGNHIAAFGDTSGTGYRPRPTMRTVF